MSGVYSLRKVSPGDLFGLKRWYSGVMSIQSEKVV